MNRHQPLSLRTTVWLAMALAVTSSILGSIGVQGYHLYRRSGVTEQVRALTVAETYAAQVAGPMGAGRLADVESFVDHLVWHPDSRMLAVLDTADGSIAQRGATPLLEAYRQAKAAAASRSSSVQVPSNRLFANVDMVAVPIRTAGGKEPIGTLVYAKARTGLNILPGPDNWGFFIYISLIAAAGISLGFLWLKRRVLDPLAVLGRLGAEGSSEASIHPLTLDRTDEIGVLARVLTSMHVDLEEWQKRATRLERSIHERVAHETERITRELKKALKKIWTDPLTRLGNRRLLEDKLEEIFRAQRDSNRELSIVMVDIDHFKQLNDTLGHQAGDELLQFTGELLRQCLREQDLAVRYGGDEFMLILPSVSPEQAEAIADRTIAMFAQRTKLLRVRQQPTMSAGIASLARHKPDSVEALLQMADAALYQAKSAGKARTSIYTPALQPAGPR
ncbi:MAG: GGDEF domain-containing protein [Planctomycetes bacterium]|nr:GGDEF domain-containing protein [Planctomycetota bacterium]